MMGNPQRLNKSQEILYAYHYYSKLRTTYCVGFVEGPVWGWRWFWHCTRAWWEEGKWRGSRRWKSCKRLGATIVENCSVSHTEKKPHAQSHLQGRSSWKYITVEKTRKSLCVFSPKHPFLVPLVSDLKQFLSSLTFWPLYWNVWVRFAWSTFVLVWMTCRTL